MNTVDSVEPICNSIWGKIETGSTLEVFYYVEPVLNLAFQQPIIGVQGKKSAKINLSFHTSTCGSLAVQIWSPLSRSNDYETTL